MLSLLTVNDWVEGNNGDGYVKSDIRMTRMTWTI